MSSCFCLTSSWIQGLSLMQQLYYSGKVLMQCMHVALMLFLAPRSIRRRRASKRCRLGARPSPGVRCFRRAPGLIQATEPGF
ncbi:hypothetical protein GW17_00026947 [Ensete ventricosum]|nr:hypothetical protein GW17_00026947 [Ensete ventricosum]